MTPKAPCGDGAARAHPAPACTPRGACHQLPKPGAIPTPRGPGRVTRPAP